MLKCFGLTALAAASLFLTIAPTTAQDGGHRHHFIRTAQATPNCVDNPSLKPGDRGYMHCRDHMAMQKVFNNGNCHCHSGECRASEWQKDSRSPVGLAFKIDGKFCPVHAVIDTKVIPVPEELRTEPGYVCIEDSIPRGPDGCPPMEDINCAIENDAS